ncbi:hypothetical protein LIER_02852 [Lithospermum erythrorhizon]|uniref:Uncharacterized protein n=1 Tax=Lithospermum erythrorhizon TaxID=34254 RepID=A0AAV3NQZ2_LITER
MVNSMSWALVDSCSKVLGSMSCRMYYRSYCIPCMHMLMAEDSKSVSLHPRLRLLHLLMKSMTSSSWRFLALVNSIILTVRLVLKKRFRNSPSSCAQLSMEFGSNSVYHSNAFPFSERTNCLTM